MDGPRVLILSSDIGEGHDLPARVLAEGIRRRRPRADIAIVDCLRAAGKVVYALVRDNSMQVLDEHPRWHDFQYHMVTRVPPIRWSANRTGYLLARRGILAIHDEIRPDVIVSTYPGANEVLAHMRRRGEVTAPLVSAITDLAALRFWAHPAFDLHLTIHAESEAEVRRLAGDRTRIAHVSGLTDPQFLEPVDRADARRELDLPQSGPVILISGGGWGIGDLEGAARVCLTTAPDATVVALCGRNEAVRAKMAADFADEPRVRAIGFTERMGIYMAAADLLIHSTAGLTVLEAQIRGARVISYGWGIAHIRANNRAYREFGLADVASTPGELAEALGSALASPREPDISLAELPSAAELVIELAERGS
jgi:processive 1,2-diacylglycerol beta-glucosyltransferase